MNEEQRYFYQPDPVTTVIAWSWTFILLFIGIIMWLEVTHFQWITATFFALFIVLASLQIFRRNLVVSDESMTFSRVMQKNYLILNRKRINKINYTKRTIRITIDGQVFYFTFMPNTLKRLQRQLKSSESEE